MRVIFLDIDGVLNSHRTAIGFQTVAMRKFDPVAVMMLHRVVKMADAAIVISSTWRLSKGWKTLIWGCLREAGWPWEEYGFVPQDECPIIGKTVDRLGPGKIRGNEIDVWLNEHPEYHDDYIILDDDSDMLESQMDRFIHCDSKVGLSYENWERIREIWPEVIKRGSL